MSKVYNFDISMAYSMGYPLESIFGANGVIYWQAAYDVELSGVLPLLLENSRGKDLVNWSITGNTTQQSGTYTGADLTVTQTLSDDYAKYDVPNFSNVVVGDKVTFKVDNVNHTLTTKKIENNEVYFDNIAENSTVSGIPANLSKSAGKNLADWSITGNTVQDGEPTPENPVDVQGVGDWDETTHKYKIPVVTRGKNLFDRTNFENGYGLATTNGLPAYNDERCATTSPLVVYDDSYIISFELIGYDYVSILYTVFDSNMTLLRRVSGVKKGEAINTSGGKYLYVCFYKTNYTITTDNIANIQIESGSTATAYEPYTEPTTTNIYLDSPLMDGETVSSDGTVRRADGTIENITPPNIPTTTGTCVLDVDTSVQPTDLSATYIPNIVAENDTVSRSYSIAYPSPNHKMDVYGVGEKTGNLCSELVVGGINSSTGAFISSTSGKRTGYIKINSSKSYTISSNHYPFQNFVCFYGVDKNYLSRTTGIGLNGERSFTTPDNAEYMAVICSRSNESQINPNDYDDFYLMINPGTTALPYEPYGYKIPVVTRGTDGAETTTNIYLDSPLMTGETVSSDGSREVEWGVKVFTGNETISNQQSQTEGYTTAYFVLNKEDVPVSSELGFCSHFQNKVLWNNDVEGFQIRKTQAQFLRFRISKEKASTIDEFKQYLTDQYNNGTPVTVYYQLATPTTSTITPTNIPTVKNTTVIDVDCEVMPTNMSLTYKSSKKPN